MAGWIMTENPEYAGVHNNSGEFTYGQTLCPGTPSDCSPDIEYSVTANIEEGNNFDSFTGTCGNISKAISAKGCNKESLVMWFNQDSNKSYDSVLDDNSIFDIKNVDECEHIIISDGGIREGGQNFEDASYKDSGFPSIATDPCSSTSGGKYAAGTTYSGHKIKYHVISDTIPANFYQNHNELVELYFPHLYTRSDTSGKNTRYIKQAAFKDCHMLSAITFSQVEEIDSEAFANCHVLDKIDWGHANCCGSHLKTIGDYAFRNIICYIDLCLDKLENIETIGVGAFSNENQQCIRKNLTLPTSKKYTEVSTYCFMNSHVMFSEIPPNIKKIGEGAFYGHCCQEIKIPNTVTEIGKQAFEANSQDIHVHNPICSGSAFRVSTKFDLSEWTVDDYNNATIAEKALGDVTVQGIIDKILVKSGAVEAFKSKFGDEYAPYIEEA